MFIFKNKTVKETIVEEDSSTAESALMGSSTFS